MCSRPHAPTPCHVARRARRACAAASLNRRNQRKKKALAETRERCNQLAAENDALLRQLEDQRREGYTVAEHFRSEVLAKNVQIAQLQVRAAWLRGQARRRAQPTTVVCPAHAATCR